MRTLAKFAAAAIVAPLVALTAPAQDQPKYQHRIQSATEILHQLNHVPDKDIPRAIASKARCVVVIPSFKKAAFAVGAEYGQGLATCYDTGKGWSAPVFVQAEGASFGFQIGGQSTDLVLVGVTNNSADRLLKDKFKLGGDIGVAAGPVGRDAQLSTTELANAGFFTYSRNKGLFAGIDLNGDEIHQNSKDTRELYGSDIPFQNILNGGTPVPAGAQTFVREVTRIFGGPNRK